MATHDYVIDNSTGANVRADINNVLLAIASNNSNSSSPTTTYAYQWWADTTSGTLKIRNSANNAWIELLQLDGTLTLEDGTVTAPALANRSNLNTGIFFSAANKFNIATGGVERMELGATTIFNEDGADVDFRIEGDTDANLFYVDAGNERIGVRTSSPSNSLDIASGNIKLGGGNGAALTWSDDVSSHYLKFTTALNGLTLNGYGGLAFETAGTNERMRIDSAGNVGIGTSSPLKKLHISDTGDVGIALQTTGANTNKEIWEITCGANASNEANLVFQSRTDAGSGGIEAMRIDSSGKLLVGLTSGLSSQNGSIQAAGPIIAKSYINAHTSDAAVLQYQSNVATLRAYGATSGSGILTFSTGGGGGSTDTERMRIDSDGNIGIGESSHNDNRIRSTSPHFHNIVAKSTNGNGGYHNFTGKNSNGSTTFSVNHNGDVQNSNNSYGQISDETLKQDIVDASSQWDDIKNITVRKFRFKDNPTGELQIGVVAQEVEKVSAGLVYEAGDVGEEVKAVKYSVLYMKAIKALQEAITKIETLETKVAALEAA